MARLKAATASLHDALEALPRMRRLVDPELTRGEYLELLRRFYRAHQVCEGHLRARAGVWESRGLDWSSRLGKTAWLAEDLRRLDPDWRPSEERPSDEGASYRGHSDEGSSDRGLSAPDNPAIRATGSALASREASRLMPYSGEGFAPAAGCLYVLEGATLGSRVILGLLGRARAQPAAGATRFFQGYGPLTGERWATLGRELQAELDQDKLALNQALEAANETYAFLRETLKNDSISLASPSESVFFDLAARFNRFMCSFWAL